MAPKTSTTASIGRTLYLVRHAQREDDVNEEWITDPSANPWGLKWDNPPLSNEGREMANELGQRLANVPIDHVFASPFDRTMQTASGILAQRNQVNIKANRILIKPETAFLETLKLCATPPSYADNVELATRHPFTDTNYKSFYDRPTITEIQKKEMSDVHELLGKSRVSEGIKHVLNSFEGETFVIVSHGASIAALLEELTGELKSVGKSSMCTLIENERGSMNFRLIEYFQPESVPPEPKEGDLVAKYLQYLQLIQNA